LSDGRGWIDDTIAQRKLRMIGVMNIERFEVQGRSAAEVRNAAKARELFVALARSDFSFLGANLAPNAQMEVVGLTPERLGRHAENPNLIPELFDRGMCFDIQQTIAENDTVCVRWEDEAITSGGKTYRNKGMTVLRFDEMGRIVSFVEYLDPIQFLEVL
jgi:ketosteroid isomerase-like protein